MREPRFRSLAPPFLSDAMLLARTLAASRRAFSASAARAAAATPPVGMAFDIDGVLIRGAAELPGARDSLLRLAAARVPYVLLTNGGGEPEAVKAAKLSSLLRLPIHPDQLILSHTPMRSRCAEFADRRVLVLGCRDVLGVARS
jgi:HAD superfamily hydrolase (TIGR01456 family)